MADDRQITLQNIIIKSSAGKCTSCNSSVFLTLCWNMLQLSCSSFILVTLLEKSFCFIDLIFLNQDYEILLGDEVELPLLTQAIFFLQLLV